VAEALAFLDTHAIEDVVAKAEEFQPDALIDLGLRYVAPSKGPFCCTSHGCKQSDTLLNVAFAQFAQRCRCIAGKAL